MTVFSRNLSYILSTLGFFSSEELTAFERADTEPCPPPADADPESAPAVDAPPEGEDEWLVWGRSR